MAKYNVPSVCWGRHFNGIFRSLPLTVIFSTSEHGCFRHYQVSRGLETYAPSAWWLAWLSMSSKVAAGGNFLVASGRADIFCLWLSYQRSHYMVALSNVESYIYNSGTWLTSAQQGILLSEDRLWAASSPLSFSLYTKLSSFFQVLCWLSCGKSEHIFLSPMK